MLCLKHSGIVLSLFQTFKSLRNIHKLTLNMNSAYFHYNNGEDQFKVTFLYQQKDIGVNRQFNFCRLVTENIEAFIGRISTNVGKVVQKAIKKKSKQSKLGDDPSTVDLVVKVLNNGVPVPGALTCHDVFFKHLHIKNLILQVEGVEYSVIINSPWIDLLALPDSIMSGFLVYPSKFDVQFVDKLKSSFSWMRSNKMSVTNKNNKPIHWELVGSNYIYESTQKDIGSKLKLICTPGNQLMTGPPVEVESETIVEAGPGLCPFDTRHVFTKKCVKPGR